MRACFCLILALLVSVAALAAEQPAPRRPPIQALLVTGGCCHDYDRQKLILTRGVSARADVRWTVVHQGGTTTDTAIPLYDDPDWAEGFDIVVHNECFSHVTDTDFVDRILKPHRDGTPAILIHCAMHCYRVDDDRWFRFVGLQSPGHGPHYSYTADNLLPEHPIMRDFGPVFVAPKGELYHSVKVFETATPLAQANRQSDGMPQVCVWTNDYHGTRVFGTTIGHYNETMAEPKYLDMLTRGLLWAVGRDADKDFTSGSQESEEAIRALLTAPVNVSDADQLPGGCCGEGNLALNKPVTSKTEQGGNFRRHLTDGRLDTRWCPDGPQSEEWVTVDLQEPHPVQQLRLHWEKPSGVAYRYLVETSLDNEAWTQVVDESENTETGAVRVHAVDTDESRYIRVTFLGATSGLWGSLWELEATAGELPELPEQTDSASPASVTDVSAPDGFDVRMFGVPPTVNYPVCLTAAPGGEVFVGVDEQGSLGKEPNGGRVLRCVDTDGDGTADRVSVFAEMDHPRGLIFEQGNGTPDDPDSLWVLHPPWLTVYHDVDGDGVADDSETLIEGISTDQVAKRGADHTTNGIRRGIDGWIYIAVGDFGFTNAVAKDGTTLSRRGGGIVRIQPDGSEMEIFSWGQRNILDVAIDPLMNIFTRDNTNDGGGWDIRLSHVLQSANYGYPSLYKNFTEEIMPPVADYGGGSGCGSMYFHDERWPAEYRDLLLTCDWGTSDVFSHRMPQYGATFEAQQDAFLKLPRPTDIDVDASGRMYVSSWKNGRFAFDGPNVGFVAQVVPHDFVPVPVSDLRRLTPSQLVAELNHPSAAFREHVQRTLLRTCAAAARTAATQALRALAGDPAAPLYSRVAAIFTDKQLNGAAANLFLNKLLEDNAVREHAVRALTDRMTQLAGVNVKRLVEALHDSQPRVQAAAVIGLARVVRRVQDHPTAEDSESEARMASGIASILLQLAHRESMPEVSGDPWRSPDPGRVIPHLAVQALVSIGAVDECLASLSTPYRSAGLWALRSMHRQQSIDGLFKLLSTSRDESLRRDVWTTLIRLYHREGDYIGGWWGTRPDTTGPYFDRQTWDQSDRIGAAVKVALAEGDAKLTEHLQAELRRHVVRLDGISSDELQAMNTPETAIQLPKADPDNPHQIANLEFSVTAARAMAADGSVEAGRELFRAQSCVSCHTTANGQTPKGPHLVDIGRRYSKSELVESIVLPAKKIAQGFDTWLFVTSDGKTHVGFVVLESAETVTIRRTDGTSEELLQDDIDERIKQETSMMPRGVVGNLTPKQLADLIAYLQSLK